MTPIIPEQVRYESKMHSPNFWDYPTRCADVELALDVTRERIEEWDAGSDPHGWWNTRPLLIALYNEIVRLRGLAGEDE